VAAGRLASAHSDRQAFSGSRNVQRSIVKPQHAFRISLEAKKAYGMADLCGIARP
jgi:hypothetical protein